MRLFTVLLLSFISVNAFALRCGNVIISEGDTLYKIYQNCQVHRSNGDYLYIRKDGMEYKLRIVGDRVNHIEYERY